MAGAIDAVAVTLAGGGRYVGWRRSAPADRRQATELAHHGANPIVGTNADLHGWPGGRRGRLLTPHPRRVVG